MITIKTTTKEIADLIIRKHKPKNFKDGTYDIEFISNTNGNITITYTYNKEATQQHKIIEAL